MQQLYGVPVYGDDIDRIADFQPLVHWLESMASEARFAIAGVHVTAAVYFGPNPETAPIGFMMVDGDVKAKVPQKGPDGSVAIVSKSVPAAAFLRGPAADLFVALKVRETEEVYFVGVRQPRVPRAKVAALELPAGMYKNFKPRLTAAAEAMEEIGLVIPPEDLYDLSQMQAAAIRAAASADDADAKSRSVLADDLREPFGLEPSIGGCDEVIRKFAVRYEISAADLALLNGRLEGLAEEREHICTTLLKLDARSALYYTDAKILSSIALFQAAEATDAWADYDARIVACVRSFWGPEARAERDAAAARMGRWVPIRIEQTEASKLKVLKL